MQKKLEASKERYENAANKFASVSHRTEVSQFTKVPSLVSFLSFYAHDVWSGKTRLQSPSIIMRSCISAHFRRWWKSIKTRFASPPLSLLQNASNSDWVKPFPLRFDSYGMCRNPFIFFIARWRDSSKKGWCWWRLWYAASLLVDL